MVVRSGHLWWMLSPPDGIHIINLDTWRSLGGRGEILSSLASHITHPLTTWGIYTHPSAYSTPHYLSYFSQQDPSQTIQPLVTSGVKGHVCIINPKRATLGGTTSCIPRTDTSQLACQCSPACPAKVSQVDPRW